MSLKKNMKMNKKTAEIYTKIGRETFFTFRGG
jgi:hypothetical protein